VPSVPSVLVQLRANLDAGDLGGALRQFGLLMRAQPTEVRWLRARDALARLVQSPTEDGGEDLEVTQQVGAVAEVDLWVRQGDLSKARARARALLELARDAAARELARRLADLDTILGALHHSGSDAPERENAPTLEEPMHLEPSEVPLAEPVDATAEEATAPRRPSLLEPPEKLPGEVVQSPREPAPLEPSAPPVEPPAPVAPTPTATPPVATPPTTPPEAQGPTGLQVKRRIVRLK
jgi:hypothetical protein